MALGAGDALNMTTRYVEVVHDYTNFTTSLIVTSSTLFHVYTFTAL